MIPGLIVLLLSQKEYPVIFLQVDDTTVSHRQTLIFTGRHNKVRTYCTLRRRL